MALDTTTAVIAGSAAAAAYLDAKLHLRKDVQTLLRLKRAEWEYARAVKSKRLANYYFFEKAVQKYPDAVAIWSRQGVYTWRETNARACQFAAYFLSLGVRPGDLVAFYMKNSPELLFAWLGLWAIGCAPALVNFNISGNPLIHCLGASSARIILVDQDEKHSARIDEETQRIENELHMNIVKLSEHVMQKIAAGNASRIDDSHRADVQGDFPAALMYTSGTTGYPKACPFTVARMQMTTNDRSRLYKQRRGQGGDRWYICMPFYHGTGGINAMIQISTGVSVAIGEKFSVRNFWADVRDSESTFIVYVGETARYLLAAPPHPLDRQHKVRCMMGNGLRPDVWRPFQERFGVPEVVEFFNSTEGVFGTINDCRGDFFAHAVGHHGAILRFALKNKFVPVETDIETGSIVRDSKTGFAIRKSYEIGGEIIVQVPSKAAFAGYRMAADATAKKFERNVFRNGDLYYRSGDALRRTTDGRWFFLDRLGDTYRWKSENVSTTEVAEVIGNFPGILEANVYGVEVPGSDGRAGCAAIIIAPEQREHFDWTSLARFAMEKLPRYAVPIFIRVVDAEVGSMAIHNNKQNKGPLRDEGINPEMRGIKLADGKNDQIFWIPPKADTYIKFEKRDWDSLAKGTARL